MGGFSMAAAAAFSLPLFWFLGRVCTFALLGGWGFRSPGTCMQRILFRWAVCCLLEEGYWSLEATPTMGPGVAELGAAE